MKKRKKKQLNKWTRSDILALTQVIIGIIVLLIELLHIWKEGS